MKRVVLMIADLDESDAITVIDLIKNALGEKSISYKEYDPDYEGPVIYFP